MLVSAGLAIIGNHDRVAIETDIQRKFEMTGSLGRLTTQMVNAETGMRGYLLTGRSEFLQPFDEATAEVPGAMARLIELATAEPGEKPRADKLARLAEIRTLTDRQLADLATQRSYVSDGRLAIAQDELVGHLSYGKNLMEVDAMQSEERGLLDDRIADINAIRVRDYVSVALALVTALVTRFVAWYLFRNGTLRRVERLTEVVRCRRDGTPGPDPLPSKRDKLGELERDIHLLDPAPRTADVGASPTRDSWPGFEGGRRPVPARSRPPPVSLDRLSRPRRRAAPHRRCGTGS